MSAGAKRDYKSAVAVAEAFRDLFFGCYDRWYIAGSIRRGKSDVSDVDHVVIAKWADVADSCDLFATPKLTNLLWARLDDIIGSGIIKMSKHIYGTTGFRWGDKQRGIDFRGFNHEVLTTSDENWGSALAIKTGPPDFSRGLVTGLLEHGYRNKDGSVWTCDICTSCHRRGCEACDNTGLVPVNKLSVYTEEEFFTLAGFKYIEPGQR